ncbi:MAG: alpha/beta fold hydrolase [Bacteroidota bacterium]
MKLHLLHLLIVLLFTKLIFVEHLKGQISDDWKSQSASYVITGSTPSDPYYYVWEEKANIMAGTHLCVLNADVIPVFIQQNINYINFTSRFSPAVAILYMLQLEVNVNNAGYNTIYSGSAKQDIVWFNSASYFTELGLYDLKVRVTFFDGTIRYRQYNVVVLPESQNLYKDNAGNTLRKWAGNDPAGKNAIVFSEGFDAYNTNPQEMYYYAASDLINCLRVNGYDVFLLDNYFGTQSLRNNAAVFASAVRYISDIYGGELIVAGGVSMGGIISRYALAKAEQDNDPLPAHTFIAIDAPHQGAIVSEPLQNFKKNNEGDDEFAKHALSNVAAKQLLNYNAYDPGGSVHDNFFQELNSMNGDGHPHLTRNIGVSFATDEPSPNSGTWYKITYHTGPLSGTIKTFELTAAEKQAGSYLPKDLTSMSPIIKQASYWWLQLLVPGITPLFYPTIEFERFTDPTYITYNSALDIRNGSSLFDVCIEPEVTTWHDHLPHEMLEEIVNAVLQTDICYQNEQLYGPWALQGRKVVAGKYVTTLMPQGDVIVHPGGALNIEASDQVMLRDGFRVKYGGEASIIANPDMYFECDNGARSPEMPNSGNSSNTNEEAEKTRLIINRKLVDELDVIIYPNPAQDFVQLQLPAEENGALRLEIYDMFTRMVLDKYIPAGERNKINIRSLKSGTYVMKISNEQKSKSLRLIKM